MKKILTSLVLCLSIFTTLFSQDAVLNRSKLPKTLYFFDDFNDNRNKWTLYNNEHTYFSIKDSKLRFENKRPNSYWFYENYSIDPTLNNYVEMEFVLEKGPDNMPNGLLFNYSPGHKANGWEFMISANGSFTVVKIVNDAYVDVEPWTYFDGINHTGNNKLGVLQKGGNAYFYINDALVFQTKRPLFCGTQIGFVAAENSVIAIDKFSIRYNPPASSDVEDTREDYKRVSLGANINSTLDDVYPVLSADGQLMFFSRCSNMGAVGIDKRTIMYAEKTATGEWGPAKALDGTVNQGHLPRVVYVSPDKNTILIGVLQRNDFRDNANEGLFICHRTATGWSSREKIEIEGWENRSYYESYAMSTTNKTLIVSTNPHNSYGQQDLYVSHKQANGRWSALRNLGAAVNTFGEEGNPCLAPDNVTLYFDSDGKPGYGKSDIFVTRRLDDTWLNWSEPQNLGPRINDRFSNFGLQVDAHGDYAYIDEFAGQGSKSEIKRFVLPEAARPNPVVIVTGKVYNMLTKEPVGLPVIYENMETGEEEGTATSSPKDGSFVLVLPYGVNYGLTAKQQGYICESKSVDLKNDSLKNGFAQMEVDLYVMPLTVGQSVTLNNIFFAPDEFELKESSFAELDRLRTIMSENPTLEIEIDGHTDRGGPNATQEQLQVLSQNRANSVRNYLNGKGIELKRITSIGFGNSKPVSDNQRLNRRVEIRIMNL